MINAKEVPTSVQAQYLTALKYATNKTKRVEVHVKEGVNHPDIEDKNNDEETNERITGWLHGSHLTVTFFSIWTHLLEEIHQQFKNCKGN